MKRLLMVFFTVMLLAAGVADARGKGNGNAPCSGKAGGISHCTADGKFVCKDGRVSKSKKKCSGYGKKSSIIDKLLKPTA